MDTKPQLADLAFCNNLALRKTARKVMQYYDNAMATTGLRSTQFHILGELYHRRKSPPTLSQLADALVMDSSGLGHNLRPLERDGYLEIQENPHDRRQRLLVLTAAGKAKLLEGLPLWAKAQEKFEALYGTQKTAELRDVFKEIAYDNRLES